MLALILEEPISEDLKARLDELCPVTKEFAPNVFLVGTTMDTSDLAVKLDLEHPKWSKLSERKKEKIRNDGKRVRFLLVNADVRSGWADRSLWDWCASVQ